MTTSDVSFANPQVDKMHALVGSAKWRHNQPIKNGHMAIAVLGAYMWGNWLHSPYHLAVPELGTKPKVRTNTLPC